MGINNFAGNNGRASGIGNVGGAGGISGIGNPSLQNGADTLDPMTFLIDYNQKFQTKGVALFREETVCQTMACLIGKDKPNALLVGQAGVGKTKIVEDIAFRIATNDIIVPDKLKGFTIYELPLASVVAGSSYVGQLEEKIIAVLDFIADPANKAILFIDEIHQLVGESQTYGKIAQILKPRLSRGEIRTIGATTLQESTNLIEDPAFNRRFSRVIIEELTKEQTVKILDIARAGFFNHYGNKISIPDDILETAVSIADQYRPAGSHRPDNALTLLDRTIAETVMARKIKEKEVMHDPALLSALQSVTVLPITEKQLRKTALRLMSGNSKQDIISKDELMIELSGIKGQDDTIDKMTDLIVKRQKPYFPKNTPLTILLAGTSGVGKTEVTNIIAKKLTGVKPITLNMGEFHSSASINRIIGAPAGYVGSDSKAELPFDCLESNPYQVILLDEFEKCDKAVQRLFMSAFDSGYITTSKGKVIDFSKAIIVATTNAGYSAGSSNTMGFGTATEKEISTKNNTKLLSKWFDTELLNRFKAIFTFQKISRDDYKLILAEIYEKEVARIKSEHRSVNIADTLPDDELERLTEETFVSEFGARPARRTIENHIETLL